MRRRDANQVAFDTLQQAIGAMPKVRPGENAEAAELGRKGGLKGGAARNAALSKAKRVEIAKKAAKTRWKKTKA